MYAHVNIWRLSQAGASPDTGTAHELASRLHGQPGFRSYMLVRTGEREVVAVTVFDSREQLERALASVKDLVDAKVKQLADGPPELREGEIAYELTAEAARAA